MIITTIAIILLWFGLVLLSRPISTFVHEMGHAIPALLFTDEAVVVHVGSYGDLSKSLGLKIGRLSIFFKFHLMQLQLGLCRHASAKYYWQTLITILGGPFMSLLFAIVLIIFMVTTRPSDAWITILTLFVLSSIWDFFINIIPRIEPIPLHDGSFSYNDGYQLRATLQEMKQPESYYKAMELFSNKEYEKALEAFQEIVEAGFENKTIHLRIIDCLVAEKEYKTAIRHYQWLASKYALQPTDHLTLGKIYQLDNQQQKAIQHLNQYLYIFFRDAITLVERGKVYLELREFERALEDFDTAVHRSPQSSNSLAK